MTENARAALALWHGEATLGIVYWIEAKAEPGVKIVGSFPEDSHPAIVRWLIIVSERAHAPA
jgi:molybdate transport system substrate-binding protein